MTCQNHTRPRDSQEGPASSCVIDAHRTAVSGGLRWGVESICHALEIAPSAYWCAKPRPASLRTMRD